MNLAKLEKFQELLHTSKNQNNGQKIIVENKLTSAAKLSFHSPNHWMNPKQCVHHQLVEEMDILNAILFFLPPPFLSLLFSRDRSLEPNTQ